MMPSATREASTTSVAGRCAVAREGAGTNPFAAAALGASKAQQTKDTLSRGIREASKCRSHALPPVRQVRRSQTTKSWRTFSPVF